MPLYGVKCINHIIVAGQVQDYEESIVVVEADSDEEAREAAAKYAIGAQTTYLNDDGETVEWVFHGTMLRLTSWSSRRHLRSRCIRSSTRITGRNLASPE